MIALLRVYYEKIETLKFHSTKSHGIILLWIDHISLIQLELPKSYIFNKSRIIERTRKSENANAFLFVSILNFEKLNSGQEIRDLKYTDQNVSVLI